MREFADPPAVKIDREEKTSTGVVRFVNVVFEGDFEEGRAQSPGMSVDVSLPILIERGETLEAFCARARRAATEVLEAAIRAPSDRRGGGG